MKLCQGVPELRNRRDRDQQGARIETTPKAGPEIGGHLLASDGWKIEREQAIVGHDGVALSLPGKKDVSTTNCYPITMNYAMSATTTSDPARIDRVSFHSH